MLATAWNNGSDPTKPAGYGIKLSRADRDHYFCRDWPSVSVWIEGFCTVRCNLSKSFWKENKPCIELRSARIGRWMLSLGIAPWPRRHPPRFALEPKGGPCFRLTRLNRGNDA